MIGKDSGKVRGLREAVALVEPGSHVSLGGFSLARNVIAFAHEVIRQGKRSLTLSQSLGGMDTDLLVGAGCADRLIFGGGSLGRFGSLPCIARAIEKREIPVEESSSFAVTSRYLAAALGIPFLPIKSLLGSDLLRALQAGEGAATVREMACPFTGEALLLVRALSPDWAVLHVQMADTDGNVRIYGARGHSVEQARAARRVMAIAEEVVSPALMREHPEWTVLPGHRVDVVVHQPFGAYPTAVFRSYDYDAEALRGYVQAAEDSARFDAYVQQYIHEMGDFAGYLEAVGGARRLETLRADPARGY
ncbi:MAG: CoA transferase subunit A [Deltaproteobacteria bacterium]|nr:CoA transferase subunit A [Deltaproteobacteria bacterium]